MGKNGIRTENYPDQWWGTYFGPMRVIPVGDNHVYEYPSIQMITPEAVSYWEKRAKEARNPLLKARCFNLVCAEKITGKKPSYKIAQIFIDSVIEIAVKENIDKYEIDVMEKLKRALSLALLINDGQRLNKLVETIINYEEKIATDDRPGLWGFSYELLVQNKKIQISQEKEHEIIHNLQERYQSLLKNGNLFGARKAASLLLDYYERNGNKENIAEILMRFEEALKDSSHKTHPFVMFEELKWLCEAYLKHDLKEDARRVSIYIRIFLRKEKYG